LSLVLLTCQRGLQADCGSSTQSSRQKITFPDGLTTRTRQRVAHPNPQSRCQTRKLPSPYTHHHTALPQLKTSNLFAIPTTHPATGNLLIDRKSSRIIWLRIRPRVVGSHIITQLALPPSSTTATGPTNTTGRGRTFTLKQMYIRGMVEEVG